MDISFWMDYSQLKEGYTIHYQKREIHSISGDLFPVPSGSQYTADLFRTFCDIMSIDFDRLIIRLFRLRSIFDGSNEFVYGEDEIINILHLISPVMLEPKLIETLTYDVLESMEEDNYSEEMEDQQTKEKIQGTLAGFTALQQYTNFYIDNNSMQDLNTYIIFINNVLRTDIPKNIIMREAIKSGDYREFRKRSTDYEVERLMKDFLKDFKQRDQSTLHYLAEGSLDFLIASMYEIVRNGYLIKRCQLCGKLFVPYNRSDTIYCDRPAPQDRKLTCKKYGSQKLWYDELKNDEAKRLARNVYQSKQMLVRRNPDIPEYAASFEKFKVQRKQWQEDVKTGRKADAEYIEWLNYVKGKKVL